MIKYDFMYVIPCFFAKNRPMSDNPVYSFRVYFWVVNTEVLTVELSLLVTERWAHTTLPHEDCIDYHVNKQTAHVNVKYPISAPLC